MAPEVLSLKDATLISKFKHRGLKLDFSQMKHSDVQVHTEGGYNAISRKVRDLADGAENFINLPSMGNTISSRHHLPCYVTALSSEPLPLHGIQYFEVRIRS